MITYVNKEFRVTSAKPADLFGHKTYVLINRQGECWEVVRGDHAGEWHTGMDVSISAEINDGTLTMDWDGDEARQLQNVSRRETEELFSE